MLDDEIMEIIRQTAKAVHESDREERRRDMDLMYERFRGEVKIIAEQYGDISDKLEGLQTDVQVLQADMVEVKSDIRILKDDVRVLKDDVRTLKKDVHNLQQGQAKLEQGQARLEQQGKEIRDSVAGHSDRLAALDHR